MKQSIVDVIAYLLEIATTQKADPVDLFSDQVIVRQRLEEAGFSQDTVHKAFDWLQDLIEQQSWYDSSARGSEVKTIRVFDREESIRIDLEARNFILSLEYAGILDTKIREIVISQLMSLNQRLIYLVDVKWVVLLVLMSNSNKSHQDLRSYLLATMALEV